MNNPCYEVFANLDLLKLVVSYIPNWAAFCRLVCRAMSRIKLTHDATALWRVYVEQEYVMSDQTANMIINELVSVKWYKTLHIFVSASQTRGNMLYKACVDDDEVFAWACKNAILHDNGIVKILINEPLRNIKKIYRALEFSRVKMNHYAAVYARLDIIEWIGEINDPYIGTYVLYKAEVYDKRPLMQWYQGKCIFDETVLSRLISMNITVDGYLAACKLLRPMHLCNKFRSPWILMMLAHTGNYELLCHRLAELHPVVDQSTMTRIIYAALAAGKYDCATAAAQYGGWPNALWCLICKNIKIDTIAWYINTYGFIVTLIRDVYDLVPEDRRDSFMNEINKAINQN